MFLTPKVHFSSSGKARRMSRSIPSERYRFCSRTAHGCSPAKRCIEASTHPIHDGIGSAEETAYDGCSCYKPRWDVDQGGRRARLVCHYLSLCLIRPKYGGFTVPHAMRTHAELVITDQCRGNDAACSFPWSSAICSTNV